MHIVYGGGAAMAVTPCQVTQPTPCPNAATTTRRVPSRNGALNTWSVCFLHADEIDRLLGTKDVRPPPPIPIVLQEKPMPKAQPDSSTSSQSPPTKRQCTWLTCGRNATCVGFCGTHWERIRALGLGDEARRGTLPSPEAVAQAWADRQARWTSPKKAAPATPTAVVTTVVEPAGDGGLIARNVPPPPAETALPEGARREPDGSVSIGLEGIDPAALVAALGGTIVEEGATAEDGCLVVDHLRGEHTPGAPVPVDAQVTVMLDTEPVADDSVDYAIMVLEERGWVCPRCGSCRTTASTDNRCMMCREFVLALPSSDSCVRLAKEIDRAEVAAVAGMIGMDPAQGRERVWDAVRERLRDRRRAIDGENEALREAATLRASVVALTAELAEERQEVAKLVKLNAAITASWMKLGRRVWALRAALEAIGGPALREIAQTEEYSDEALIGAAHRCSVPVGATPITTPLGLLPAGDQPAPSREELRSLHLARVRVQAQALEFYDRLPKEEFILRGLDLARLADGVCMDSADIFEQEELEKIEAFTLRLFAERRARLEGILFGELAEVRGG